MKETNFAGNLTLLLKKELSFEQSVQNQNSASVFEMQLKRT